MDINRKKNRLRKEMALLIDSIKEHSDGIGNRDHVPQLVLEVINSKIKKLYEKSVVFSYLHASGEEESEQSLNVTSNTLEHIEVPVVNMFSMPTEAIIKEPENTPTTNIPPQVAESNSDTPMSDNLTQHVNSIEEINIKLKDIKEFIGLNDKIQFVSTLFKSDITRYEYFISKLNACQNESENNEIINENKKLMQWKEDDDAFQNLVSITQLRYK
jgi:hypothetical protein